MSEMVLEFHSIIFSYPSGEREVLSDLNLGVPNGGIMTILGPNGAGKTTLLHIALGWLKPGSGQVHLDGRPLSTYSRREIGQWIGLVPQIEHIPFDYSVLDYILFGRTPYLRPLEMPSEKDFEIAQQALKRVGLVHLADHSVTNLSGGERQMVLIARALAQQPRILLLDEPTSHLDINNKGRMVKLLRQLSLEGVTILFSTHEPDVAAAIAKQAVLMRDGKILKAGMIADVITDQDLSNCYQTPVRVVEIEKRYVVLWN